MLGATSEIKSKNMALAAAMSATVLCVLVLQASNDCSGLALFDTAAEKKSLLRGPSNIAAKIVDPVQGNNSSNSNKRDRPKELKFVRSSWKESSRRRLPSIQGFGGQPDPWLFPLQECQGDCDSDSDCDQGLVCFQRNGGERVPGCSGKTDNSIKTDYCIKNNVGATGDVTDGVDIANAATGAETETLNDEQRKPTGILNMVGQNGIPSSAYPLDLCEGECDRDSDCAENLICYQRQAGESVPGCQGAEGYYSRSDFCVWKDIWSETWKPTWAPSWNPTFSPTFSAPTENAAVPPTIIPSADATTESPSVSATFEASSGTSSLKASMDTDSPSSPIVAVSDVALVFPELLRVGNNGVFTTFPLENCMGDCDSSDDASKWFAAVFQCADDFICFFRLGDEDVPGCSGTGDYGVDYCIMPPKVVDTIVANGLQEVASIAPSIVEVPASNTANPSNEAAPNSSGNESQISPSLNVVMSAFEFVVDSPASPPERDVETEASRKGVDSQFGKEVSSHKSSPVEKNVGTADTALLAEERQDDDPEERSKDKEKDMGKDDGDDGDDDDDHDRDDSKLPSLSLLGADSEFEIWPLDVCQGSCFYDYDCLEGLQCFQRDGYESVPGCKGRGHNSANYCVPIILNAADGALGATKTPALLPSISFAPSMTDTATATITSSNTEIVSPSFAETGAGTAQTTLSGSPLILPALSSTLTPTAVDTLPSLPRPQVVGNNNIFDIYPLTACLGDCDTDGDCIEGLKCFQRQGFEPVPGCDSQFPARLGADYCVEAKHVPILDQEESEGTQIDVVEELQNLITSTPLKPLMPPGDEETLVPSSAATIHPTSTNLVAVHASLTVTASPAVEPTNVPGTTIPTTTETVTPTFSSEVLLPTDSTNGTKAPGSLSIVFDPLSYLNVCEGDCDSHQDCAEGLFCFHRNGNEMPVPGCVGSAPSVADFCVDIKYMISENIEPYIETDADANAEIEMEKEEEAWEEAIVHTPFLTPSPAPSPSSVNPSPSLTWILAAVGTSVAPTETNNPQKTLFPSSSESAESSQQLTESTTSPPSNFDSAATTAGPSSGSTTDSTSSPSFVATNSAIVVESTFVATFSPSESESATLSPSDDASSEGTVYAREYGTTTPSGNSSNITVSSSSDSVLSVIENAEDSMTPEPSKTDSPTTPSSEVGTSAMSEYHNVTVSPFEPLEADKPTPEESTSIMNALDNPSKTDAPSQMPYLRMIGNDGTFDSYPLEECEGDCDESADCNPGLVCMQRISNEEVPGCQGKAEFSVDYCVKVEYLMADDFVSLIDRSKEGSGFGS